MQPFVKTLRQKLALTAFALVLTATASATLSVNVISPTLNYQGTATGGTPVFYEAYATNPNCAAGIGAMRIYTAPGVNAFTVNGDHLETFIALPLGTYNTVVQAWDNCGNVAKTAAPLTVTSGNISIYLPTGEVTNGPVHIAASAQTGCDQGISAMRLYTAPYAAPYTIDSNQLDTYVTVPLGNYNMTLVAWDNCGSVFTSNFFSAVSGSPDGYLYGTYAAGNTIAELEISDAGQVINPNGDSDPPQFPANNANSLVVDPGGWFLYAGEPNGVYAFQINPENGALSAIPGSPFAGSGITRILMDPSGNFLYSVSNTISTFRINRSNGSLTPTGNSVPLPSAYFFGGAIDGPFFYFLSASPKDDLWGYSLNANNGALTPISGLPVNFNRNVPITALAAADYHVYVATGEGVGKIYGYDIDPASGALAHIPGSPFEYEGGNFPAVWIDWSGRYLWPWQQDTTSSTNDIQPLDIGSNGRLTLVDGGTFGGADGFSGFTEDLTGNYVFTDWTNAILPPIPQQGGTEVGVQTFYISDGVLAPSYSTVLPNTFNVGAIARQNPN
ncbi:MAG: beta-propeller fold lactonase family protein [Terriglobales bacterium]|jgi:6-phosphogluconolactonase (cycloisomerase 2 family)